MRRFPALVLSCLLAGLLGLLAGCGPSQSGPGTPEPARDSSSAASSSSSDATSTDAPSSSSAVPDVRRDDSQAGAAFATPSGNITCFVDTGKGEQGAAPSTGCTITMKTWKAPASRCTLAYGDLISFTGTKPAKFDCRGDVPSCFLAQVDQPDACGTSETGLWWHQDSDGTVKLPDTDGADGAVLPYGSAVRIGSVQCTSRESGVTCADLDSGQGFTISRSAYSLTP